MPKIKSKSAAKKRFRFTATGKVKHYGASLSHNTSKRPRQMIRQNRGSAVLSDCDARIVIRNHLRGQI
ncbi:MAG: 50S ribosomal protein L35 [Alphaproteobacteria bacterium]